LYFTNLDGEAFASAPNPDDIQQYASPDNFDAFSEKDPVLLSDDESDDDKAQVAEEDNENDEENAGPPPTVADENNRPTPDTFTLLKECMFVLILNMLNFFISVTIITVFHVTPVSLSSTHFHTSCR